MTRSVSTLAIAFVAVMLMATPALAHVDLAASDPAHGTTIEQPVDEITFEFSTESVAVFDGFVIYGSDGGVIDAEALQVSDTVVKIVPASPLGDGTYAATWSMQAGDAHPITGGIEFSVAVSGVEAPPAPAAAPADPGDDASPATAVPSSMTGTVGPAPGESLLASVLERPASPIGSFTSTVARAASITTTLVGLGALAFGALVLQGSRREAEVVGFWMRRSGAGVLAAVPLLLVGRALETGAGGLGAIGATAILQTVGGVGLLVGTRIATVADDRHLESTRTVATLRDQRFRLASSPTALAGAAALLAAFAVDGHSNLSWLMRVGSVIHVAAAAVWVGGVALLARTLVGRVHRAEPVEAGPLVIAFSVVATAAITAVGVAGAVMAFTIADGLGTFFTTPWGWALLAKLGFVGVAASIGAYNHFVVVPMLRHDQDHPVATNTILSTIRIEMVALVLAATISGALVGLSAA